MQKIFLKFQRKVKECNFCFILTVPFLICPVSTGSNVLIDEPLLSFFFLFFSFLPNVMIIH